MLKKLQDDGFTFKYVYITGISNTRISFNEVKKEIDKICGNFEVIIQFFNSHLIAGWEHIFFSTIHSLKAFKQGINISNNLELEILLYVSGQHQIKVAIEKFGIDLETQNIAMTILGNNINSIENAKIEVLALIKGIEDEAVLNITKEKFESICKNFDISQLEIETVSNSNGWGDKLDAIIKIVLNRIAFVIFEK